MKVVFGSRLLITCVVTGTAAGSGWFTPAASAGLLVDGFHPRPTHVIQPATSPSGGLTPAAGEGQPSSSLGFGPYRPPDEDPAASPVSRPESLRQTLIKQVGPAVVSLFFFPATPPPPSPPPPPPDNPPPPQGGSGSPPPQTPPVVPPPPPPPAPPPPPPHTDPVFPPPPRDSGIPPDHPTQGSDTPEPATFLSGLLGSGLAGLVALSRRKRRQS